MRKIKKNITPQILCSKYDSDLEEFLNEIMKLDFADSPDYKMMKMMLIALINKSKIKNK